MYLRLEEGRDEHPEIPNEAWLAAAEIVLGGERFDHEGEEDGEEQGEKGREEGAH